MAEALLERRRAPRVAVAPGTEVGVPTGLTVRLLDISASGVLISSPQKMAVGQRARLQLTLGGEPLNVEVEVRRVAEGGTMMDAVGRSRFRLGAAFVDPDEYARRSVQHFLRADQV
jgi:hypothetical protein